MLGQTNQHDYVNNIELAWLLMGVLGACVNLWAGVDAWTDRQVVHALHARGLFSNGVTTKLANGHIRTEFLGLVANLLVVTIGIMAVSLSPSPYPTTTISWFFTGILFAIPSLFVLNALLDRRMRHQILNIQMEHEGIEEK